MTKHDIANTLAITYDMDQRRMRQIIQDVLDAIIDTIVAEGRIELRGFGVFTAKKRKARTCRNPKTGELVEVAAKYIVSFKAGKEMKQKMRALPMTSPLLTIRGEGVE